MTIQIADYATPTPHSIGPEASLADAHRLMRANRIRHLPVLDGNRVLLGLVSQRDLLLMETIQGVDPEKVQVEEAMNRTPYVVQRTTPVQIAALHMWQHKLGSALVVDDQRVVGIFSTTDALQALVEVLAQKSVRQVAAPRAKARSKKATRPSAGNHK